MLFSNLIPISMYITLEIVYLIHNFYISWDLTLYSNNTSAKCLNNSSHTDLGQTDYIFLDKTGTITESHMKFKMCTIG